MRMFNESTSEIAIINGVCEEDEVLPEVLQTKNESVIHFIGLD